MSQQITPETWLLIGAGGCLVGLVLIAVGLWRRRKGDDPHCRKCDYNLTGLPEPRCPECGVEITEKLIRYGTRYRRPTYALVGLILLALAAIPIYHGVGRINWYTHYPSSWVARDMLQAATFNKAYGELDRRIKAGRHRSVARALIHSTDTRPLDFRWYTLLAQAGGPEAETYFEDVLQSPDPEAGRWAALGLEQGGGRWAVPILIRALDNPMLRDVDEECNSISIADHVTYLTTADGKAYTIRPGDTKPADLDEGSWQLVQDSFRESARWPDEHHAHRALGSMMWRFGLKGRLQNLAVDGRFNIDAEIERLKAWWAKHGEAFMQGKPVPSPELTMLMYWT